jgi:hypothetical protein
MPRVAPEHRPVAKALRHRILGLVRMTQVSERVRHEIYAVVVASEPRREASARPKHEIPQVRVGTVVVMIRALLMSMSTDVFRSGWGCESTAMAASPEQMLVSQFQVHALNLEEQSV